MPYSLPLAQLLNPIFESVLKSRKGHYCHCIEVESVYELENLAESICMEFPEQPEAVIIEFLASLSVYSLAEDPQTENDIYSFSFTDFLAGTID